VLEADRPPGEEILLRHPAGYELETSFAAFLGVKDGSLIVPPAEFVLRSISCEYILELCDRLQIHHCERRLDELTIKYDEAMLAGTGFGIAGVRKLDDQLLDWPGPVLQRLQAAFTADVGPGHFP
jgi:branched-subunit amino acid aminotransferase/4-amino-4-deoxychorismate lyase